MTNRDALVSGISCSNVTGGESNQETYKSVDSFTHASGVKSVVPQESSGGSRTVITTLTTGSLNLRFTPRKILPGGTSKL